MQAGKTGCLPSNKKQTMSGMSQWWPLFHLRLQTPGLELRLPSDSDLDALASLAASGVHEMRAAVLHLAFAGLNAQYATSGAFADNLASLGVSRKLGYAADGVDRQVSRGQPATTMRLRLDRPTWESTHTVPVAITGLEPCLPLLGLAGGQCDAG